MQKLPFKVRPAYWSQLHPSQYTFKKPDGRVAGIGLLFSKTQIKSADDLDTACAQLAAWNLIHDKFNMLSADGLDNAIAPLTFLQGALRVPTDDGTPLYEVVCSHRPDTWRAWWKANQKAATPDGRRLINHYMSLPVAA